MGRFRGRGSGMTRGGPMSDRGRGGFHPGMRGRGILRGVPPRGMGFHHRGSGPPRGSGGPPSRGRPPIYNTHHHSHSGGGPPSSASPNDGGSVAAAGAVGSAVKTLSPVGGAVPASAGGPTNGSHSSDGGPPSSRGAPRGRGTFGMSRGRGSYTPNIHVGGGGGGGDRDMSGGGPPAPKPFHRGGPPRGRGGSYMMNTMSRPSPGAQSGGGGGVGMSHQHQNSAPVQSLKRGPPVGPIGAKRGRYDQSGGVGGPPSRPYMPKYQSYNQQQAPAHQQTQHSSYYNQSSQVQR